MVASEAATTPPIVICDAGPLIHLDELGCIDLLSDFPSVLVPESVWQEVERHRATALAYPAVRLKRVQPPVTPSPELEALVRLLPLHVGEAEALAVAIQYPGAGLLTDDTAARLAARTLGIVAHGTLGVLIRAIRRGQRTRQQVLDTLRLLPAVSSIHLKPALLEEVIQQVKRDATDGN